MTNGTVFGGGRRMARGDEGRCVASRLHANQCRHIAVPMRNGVVHRQTEERQQGQQHARYRMEFTHFVLFLPPGTGA